MDVHHFFTTCTQMCLIHTLVCCVCYCGPLIFLFSLQTNQLQQGCTKVSHSTALCEAGLPKVKYCHTVRYISGQRSHSCTFLNQQFLNQLYVCVSVYLFCIVQTSQSVIRHEFRLPAQMRPEVVQLIQYMYSINVQVQYMTNDSSNYFQHFKGYSKDRVKVSWLSEKEPFCDTCF